MAQPVRLWHDKKSRDIQESKADLFAIIKTTEKLERAYVRDAVGSAEYEVACERLIQQFKVLWSAVKDQVPDVERFMSEMNMQCPMAASRLLHSGLPATIEHQSKQRTNDPDSVSVAESVQHFITCMDALKLNMVAVDQICPILSDLLNSLTKIQTLPADFGPKTKVKEAYQKLYQKSANYELPEEDVRQLLYDLESSYNVFLATLKNRS